LVATLFSIPSNENVRLKYNPAKNNTNEKMRNTIFRSIGLYLIITADKYI